MNELLRCDLSGIPYMVQNLKDFGTVIEFTLFNGNTIFMGKRKLLPYYVDQDMSKLLDNDLEFLLCCVEEWCISNFKNYGLNKTQLGRIIIPDVEITYE